MGISSDSGRIFDAGRPSSADSHGIKDAGSRTVDKKITLVGIRTLKQESSFPDSLITNSALSAPSALMAAACLVEPKSDRERRTIIRTLKDEHQLVGERAAALDLICQKVPAERMEYLLANKPEGCSTQALLETFIAAGKSLEKADKRTTAYFGKQYLEKKPNRAQKPPKTITQYAFMITKEGHLYISFDERARGKTKKVSAAILVNTQEQKVKVAVRDLHVAEVEDERTLQNKLASHNDYILSSDDRTTFGSKTGKYVYFDAALKGDGSLIKSGTPRQLIAYLHDFAKGLDGMHQMGFVHGDVKQENTLIKEDNGVIKTYIADFGHTTEAGKQLINVGTPAYQAPEIFRLTNAIDAATHYIPWIKEQVKVITEGLLPGEVNQSFEGIKNLPDLSKKVRDAIAELESFELISLEKVAALIQGQQDSIRSGMEALRHVQADSKQDSFSLGVSILMKVAGPVIEDLIKEQEVFLAGLSENEHVDHFFGAIREYVDLSLSKDLFLKLIGIAKELTAIDPKQRISCGDAAKKIEALQAQ